MKSLFLIIITLAICCNTLFSLTFKHHYPMDRLNDFEFFQDGVLLNTSGMEGIEYYTINDSLDIELQYTISIPPLHYLQKFCLNDSILYGLNGICGRDRYLEFYVFELSLNGFTELSSIDIMNFSGATSYFSPMIFHDNRVIFQRRYSDEYLRINVEDSLNPFLENVLDVGMQGTSDMCNDIDTYQDSLLISSRAIGTAFNGNFRLIKNTPDSFTSLFVGGLNRPSYTGGLATIDSTLFLAHLYGLIVYDISDFNNIQETFFYPTEWGRDIIAIGDYIIIGADDGWYVFRFYNQYAIQFVEHLENDNRILDLKLRPERDELWCSVDGGDLGGLVVFDVSEYLNPQNDPILINVPGDQPTIQAAIDVSADGDTILVQSGMYVENINYNGKKIVIGSLYLTTQDTSYVSQTIINGNQNESVVTFTLGENSEAILTGFTLTEGYAMNGGGINCCNSSPRLTNLIITNNTAGIGLYDGGGGIHLSNSNAVIENVVIKSNESFHSGGGIYCRDNSNTIFSNVKISNNTAYNEGGGMLCRESNPNFTNSIISNNTCSDGGGISCFLNVGLTMVNTLLSNNQANRGAALYLRDNCNVLLINTTLSENTAYDFGGGMYCKKNSNPILINSIFWNDSPEEIYLAENNEPSSITITYSDIQAGETGIIFNNGSVNWLEGNIDDDPLFGWHYYLPENSPCVDTGTPFFEWQGNILLDLTPEDFYGIAPDMGAYEYGFLIAEDFTEIPLQDCILSQNYPNPFNPTTTIEFSIKNNSKVELAIFNIKGQKIKTLSHNEFTKGSHSIIWNGDDELGNSVSSGIYYYKLNVNGKTEVVKKCLLLK